MMLSRLYRPKFLRFSRKAYRANGDLLEGVEWTAVLDGRSCSQCFPLDGLAWSLPSHEPRGHQIRWPGPPPKHHACRCTSLPVLKSWADLVHDQDISQRVRQALQGLPAGTRASMDGQVSRTLNFEAWLKTKPKAFQQEILGPGRWELWQRGKISFLDLIDQRARPLSLEQLRRLVEDAS